MIEFPNIARKGNGSIMDNCLSEVSVACTITCIVGNPFLMVARVHIRVTENDNGTQNNTKRIQYGHLFLSYSSSNERGFHSRSCL